MKKLLSLSILFIAFITFIFVGYSGKCIEHVVVVDKGIKPTCIETGLTEGSHCEKCGQILVIQEEIPALGHTEEIDSEISPTCIQVGKSEGKHCKICGEILIAQEEIAATGHIEETDSKILPTCIQAGKSEGRHCKICGEILIAQEEIPALGHTEEIDGGILPTCTETGKSEGKHCVVCGETLVAQVEIPAVGHMVVIDNAILPTYTNYGLTEGKHCSVCKNILIKQETIEKLSLPWYLILVNPWNYIPDSYNENIELKIYDSHKVDARCYDALKLMIDDCKAAGNTPYITSAFRTTEEQKQLFNNSVNKYMSKGYSYDEAYKLTARSIAIPGTSEHQLGLAIDISPSKTQQWLKNNSYKYGFIQRYPKDKSHITGIMYESWHFRYVGVDAATQIYNSGCCLEEYLEMVYK